jgi:hypothetical protein
MTSRVKLTVGCFPIQSANEHFSAEEGLLANWPPKQKCSYIENEKPQNKEKKYLDCLQTAT